MESLPTPGAVESATHPPAAYEPEDSELLKNWRFAQMEDSDFPIRRQSYRPPSENKWKRYSNYIGSQCRNLVKEIHFSDVYQQERRPTLAIGYYSNIKDLNPFEKKIFQCKKKIREAFQRLGAENSSHRRYPELAEEGATLVPVEHIVCSKCGEPDSEGNDILLCDRKGCNRAYHQNCLDPPLSSTYIQEHADESWFCWQCACIDRCLLVVNEHCETEYDDWRDVFIEVMPIDDSNEKSSASASSSSSSSSNAGGAAGAVSRPRTIIDDDEEEDANDEDYTSSCEDEDETAAPVRPAAKRAASSTASGLLGATGGAFADDDSDESDAEVDEDEEDSDDDDSMDDMPMRHGKRKLSDADDQEVVAQGTAAQRRAEKQGDSESDSDDEDEGEVIDPEEIRALLAESGMTVEGLQELSQSNATDEISSFVEGESAGVHRYHLRKRSSEGTYKPTYLTEDEIVDGSLFVDQEVARVKRGYVITGTVTAFRSDTLALPPPADGAAPAAVTCDGAAAGAPAARVLRFWEVSFEDGTKSTLDVTALREAINLHIEYMAEVDDEDEEEEEAEEEKPSKSVVDTGNIISGKRARKEVDYVSLSADMFGDASDDDEEAEMHAGGGGGGAVQSHTVHLHHAPNNMTTAGALHTAVVAQRLAQQHQQLQQQHHQQHQHQQLQQQQQQQLLGLHQQQLLQQQQQLLQHQQHQHQQHLQAQAQQQLQQLQHAAHHLPISRV